MNDEQPPDTVAQKPDNIGNGVPKNPPARNTDLDQEDPTPGAQPPVESTEARIGKAPKIAAGLPAIYQTMRFAVRAMGVARGTKTLLQLNQKTGFDCQSCAWPSPDDERQ